MNPLLSKEFEVIAAKVLPGAFDDELLQRGFVAGNAVECKQCDCAYRLYYRPEAGLMEQSILYQTPEDTINSAHPNHEDRLYFFPSPAPLGEN